MEHTYMWHGLCKIPILLNDCFKYPWIICIEEGWGRRAPITRTNIITVVHWFVNIHILLRKSHLLDCCTNTSVLSSTCKWFQSSMTILFVCFSLRLVFELPLCWCFDYYYYGFLFDNRWHSDLLRDEDSAPGLMTPIRLPSPLPTAPLSDDRIVRRSVVMRSVAHKCVACSVVMGLLLLLDHLRAVSIWRSLQIQTQIQIQKRTVQCVAGGDDLCGAASAVWWSLQGQWRGKRQLEEEDHTWIPRRQIQIQMQIHEYPRDKYKYKYRDTQETNTHTDANTWIPRRQIQIQITMHEYPGDKCKHRCKYINTQETNTNEYTIT